MRDEKIQSPIPKSKIRKNIEKQPETERYLNRKFHPSSLILHPSALILHPFSYEY
jgi:hypothetical protein